MSVYHNLNVYYNDIMMLHKYLIMSFLRWFFLILSIVPTIVFGWLALYTSWIPKFVPMLWGTGTAVILFISYTYKKHHECKNNTQIERNGTINNCCDSLPICIRHTTDICGSACGCYDSEINPNITAVESCIGAKKHYMKLYRKYIETANDEVFNREPSSKLPKVSIYEVFLDAARSQSLFDRLGMVTRIGDPCSSDDFAESFNSTIKSECRKLSQEEIKNGTQEERIERSIIYILKTEYVHFYTIDCVLEIRMKILIRILSQNPSPFNDEKRKEIVEYMYSAWTNVNRDKPLKVTIITDDLIDVWNDLIRTQDTKYQIMLVNVDV